MEWQFEEVRNQAQEQRRLNANHSIPATNCAALKALFPQLPFKVSWYLRVFLLACTQKGIKKTDKDQFLRAKPSVPLSSVNKIDKVPAHPTTDSQSLPVIAIIPR